MPRPSRRIADSTSHLDIAHDGEVYRVTLKRLTSARRFTLRVRAATRDVVLTMPPRGSLVGARTFAQRHAAWIGVRLRRLPAAAPFGAGSTVPLRGVAHEIVHRPGARRPVWAEFDTIDGVPRICVSGDLPHLARRVRDFLVREARRDLDVAVARHTARLGVAARRITLRDTTSRWGSCSSAGALNFSWRLIMAPAFVLDYLAAHEATHLIHMNHGDAFWRLLATLSPDVDRAEGWLKTQGTELLRFGPFKG